MVRLWATCFKQRAITMHSSELELALTFVQAHPDAAARELELQPPEITAGLMNTLPLPQGRDVMKQLLPTYAARVCAQLSVDRAVGLLVGSSVNQVASILRCLPKINRKALVKGLPEKTAALCRLMLSYSEDTVGAWMTADIVMLPVDSVAGEALQRLALSGGVTDSEAIPVIDKSQQVIGTAAMRDLLRAQEQTTVSQIMHEVPAALSSRTSLASASRHEGWRQRDIMMVLNRNRQLVGMLRHLDLRRSLERFGELTGQVPQSDLLSGISEVYSGALSAMLGLVSGQQGNKGAAINVGERR